jgi:Fe-S-cluster containining protein
MTPGSADTLPAGDFSVWLHETRNALRSGTAVDVPCGTCTACCTSSYFIHIRADETSALARIDKDVLAPARGMSKGDLLMGYDEQGVCPQLKGSTAEQTGGTCAIYSDRPRTCRSYDCRVFAAAGLSAGEDKPRINTRVKQWRFDYPTPRDRAAHEAVQAAARFIRDNAVLFPGGKIPQDPSQLAILAIKVSGVFSEAMESGKNLSPAEIAEAIVAESRTFN